jgi:hypothetical protein
MQSESAFSAITRFGSGQDHGLFGTEVPEIGFLPNSVHVIDLPFLLDLAV